MRRKEEKGKERRDHSPNHGPSDVEYREQCTVLALEVTRKLFIRIGETEEHDKNGCRKKKSRLGLRKLKNHTFGGH